MRRRPAGRPDGGEFAPGLEATDDDIEVQVRNFEIRDVRGRGSAKPPALDEDDVWAAVRAMPAGSRLASEAMRLRPGDAALTAAIWRKTDALGVRAWMLRHRAMDDAVFRLRGTDGAVAGNPWITDAQRAALGSDGPMAADPAVRRKWIADHLDLIETDDALRRLCRTDPDTEARDSALMSAPANRVLLAAWTRAEGRQLCRLVGPIVDADRAIVAYSGPHGVVLRSGADVHVGVERVRGGWRLLDAAGRRSAPLSTEHAARVIGHMMGAR